MKELYKQLKERLEYLQAQKQTIKNKERINELTLTIIRVQQIMLSELNTEELKTSLNNDKCIFTNVFVEIDSNIIPIRNLEKNKYETFLEDMHRLRLAYLTIVLKK